MDLQLGYLAAPQSAAQANAAQQAPQAAQAAAQAAFINEIEKREETIEESQKSARGHGIRTNPDRQHQGQGYSPGQRRRPAQGEPESEDGFGLEGEDEHFIDFTA